MTATTPTHNKSLNKIQNVQFVGIAQHGLTVSQMLRSMMQWNEINSTLHAAHPFLTKKGAGKRLHFTIYLVCLTSTLEHIYSRLKLTGHFLRFWKVH